MSLFFFPSIQAVHYHIPKTGGTSIRDGAFKGEYTGPRFSGTLPHWPRERTFTFVRCPYDRAVSCLAFLRATFPEEDLTMEKMIEIASDESIDPARLDAEDCEERQRSYIRHHVLPQTHAHYRMEDARFVGRFERLDEDFAALCRWLGIGERDLPHLLRSKRGPWQDHLGEKERRLVEDFYRDDFTFLPYRKENEK